MKIFITGSESFVARELIKQCLERGIEVSGIDFAKSSDLPYQFIKGDITEPELASKIPEGVDAVVHLAALSRDQDCAGKAYECFNVNVMGTLNVMRAAKAKNAKQSIFASSEWVYEKFVGDEEKDEEAFIDIAGHTSEYALSKLVSEANLREEYKHGFMPTTIFRFAIIYGPRKTNWAAVESVMSAVKNSDTVTVGSLKSGRRFLHVSDIARGITAAFGRTDFQIINLSADKLVRMEDIIRESEKIFGKKVKIIELNPAAISVRNPSNKKAKELLGWRPQVGLVAGLQTLLPFV
ncbi:MAG TPA: NAD(P)-dependent oxidoreductase [Candidatus Paceibacterota bacterium]|nr:NAD(P)-dependent oxidoreductase [Candidatus Paceibacterota bacterium]